MRIMVEKASPELLQSLDIASWSEWECEPSEFEWEYPENERAYVREGEVLVHTADGTVSVRAGDVVFFPKGLKCRWEIKKTIRKVYRFE